MTADQLAPEAPAQQRAASDTRRSRVSAVRNAIRVAVGGPACRGEDPELFFPDNDTLSAAEPARIICRRCPKKIFSSCLEDALTHAVEGIWGATTETDRDLIRERHGLIAEPLTTSYREIRTDAVRDLTEHEGLSANEIATRLNITKRTVVRHRSQIGETA